MWLGGSVGGNLIEVVRVCVCVCVCEYMWLGGSVGGNLIEVVLVCVCVCVCVYVLSTFVHEVLKARLTLEGKAGELLLGGLVV